MRDWSDAECDDEWERQQELAKRKPPLSPSAGSVKREKDTKRRNLRRWRESRLRRLQWTSPKTDRQMQREAQLTACLLTT